jgi:hypothetical protein
MGRHTREFRAAGYAADGIDRPYEGRTQERAALPDVVANLYLSDEDGNFPFGDGSYDCRFSTSVFEHVMEYDKPISEIAQGGAAAGRLDAARVPSPMASHRAAHLRALRRPLPELGLVQALGESRHPQRLPT